MKIVLEEYGGMVLACMASLAILTINISLFVGPIANKIIYLVNANG